MLRAAIYLRVSTAEQAGNDHVSLDTQEHACRRFAEGREWDVVAVYQDVESGSKPSRSNYRRLLDDAAARQFEAVIVYDSSRWGRDAGEVLLSVAALESTGAKIHSTMGDMENFLSIGMTAVMNEDHLRKLSKNVRTNLQRIAEKGEWPGSKLAIGYRREGTGTVVAGEIDPRTGKRKRSHEGKRIVIDEETGPMIRRIFEMAANGATFAKCAATLAEWGHPMTETAVKRMFSNPFYRGQLRWIDASPHLEFKAAAAAGRSGKRAKLVYQGNHPALIDEALWARTQDAITRRMFKLRRANTGLSAGLVACGHCGRAAHWHRVSWRCRKDGEFTGEVRYYAYYQCKLTSLSECKWTIRDYKVDNWLRAQLRTIVVRPDSIDRMAALLDAQRDDILAKHEAARQAVERNLKALHDRDGKLMDAMLDGTVSKPDYIKRHNEFTSAIQQAEAELTAFRPAELPDYAAFIANLRQLPAELARGDNKKLRPLLRSMGLRVDVRSETDIRLVGFMEGLL